MQYLDDILCLEYDELVPVIIEKPDTYNKLRRRGNITVHGVGGNGRKVLIEFESMPERYKVQVVEHYGDPYLYASKQPILDALIWDDEAYSYYSKYMLPNGHQLPCSDNDLNGKPQINYVDRYTTNATWLNMLGRMTADKRTLKQELNISIADFWQTTTDLIRIKEVAIPSNAKRLKAKLKEYLQTREDHGSHAAYDYLVETHKFGNDHSKKVKDEVAEAYLKDLLSENHDDTIVRLGYNDWANKNGRELLESTEAVRYRRKLWKVELTLEREGLSSVNKKLSKKIKGFRPTAPLLLVNSDDNVLDLYFRKLDEKGKNDWYRPVLYVVMDSFNDYPLGYAWGDSVTIELVKEAYRNAQKYVERLTGAPYGWQQLQTDKWSLDNKQENQLGQFYRSMATSTPAALKNANSKYIEQAFGTTWHQLLKLESRQMGNYSGHNLTAKKQINRDNLKPANFPYVEDADAWIAGHIHNYRNTINRKTGKTKHEEWLEAFEASEKSKKKLWSIAEKLQIFGRKHHHLNRINDYGVTPTLLGEKRYYEMSQADIAMDINTKVQVYYDEDDLSQVLITDGKSMRKVLHEWKAVPRAIADYEEGDAERIKRLQEEKKTLLPMMQKNIEERKAILDRERIDAESRLSAGVMVKEVAQADMRLLQGGTLRQAQGDSHSEDEEMEYVIMDDPSTSSGQGMMKKEERRSNGSVWDAI